MKELLLALILLAGEITLVNSSAEEGVIVNGREKAVICYLYYDDGNFIKRFVPANSESKPFLIAGLKEVACF